MDLERQKVLNGLVVGIELEFYTTLPRKDVAKEIGALVRKKVTVGTAYHSELPLTGDSWKLEPDFSGGVKMHELITGKMEYHEAVACLAKLLSWIRVNGWTDEKCAMHVNVSFDEKKIKLRTKLEAINRMKFVLGFNEDFIYEKFPKRKNSIYARSINSIFPINKFVFTDDVYGVHRENYELPNEKYYGINFSKLAKGYLEIRYLGGRGYEKHFHDAREIIDYIGTFIYDVLQNNESYTPQEVIKLRNTMKDFKKVVNSFSDMDNFFLNYPNIQLMVDLKGDREILKTFYPKIREKLFDLIIRCGVRRGMINYDSDIGKYQIKNAIISKAFPLNEMEVFDSKISSGNVINCDLYRCHIANSHILDSNLYTGNTVFKSKIVNTPFHAYNACEDTYIDNKKLIINGRVQGGIIRSGEVGPLAHVSDETEVIDAVLDQKDRPDKPSK